MNMNGLRTFLSGDFKWFVIAVAVFFLIKPLKEQKYLHALGIVALATFIIMFASGADFSSVMRWLLGLFGIRV